VEFLCRIMQVTSRGYRAWRVRPMSQRQRGELAHGEPGRRDAKCITLELVAVYRCHIRSP
jgi:hypothetical protein